MFDIAWSFSIGVFHVESNFVVLFDGELEIITGSEKWWLPWCWP